MPSTSPASTPMRQPYSQHPKRAKYSAARAFYIAIPVTLALAILSLWSSQRLVYGSDGQINWLAARNPPIYDHYEPAGSALIRRDQACRLVHAAPDKCAFVRRNCPDEEAGLFSYLQLYYCKLHKAKPVAFVILLLWLGLLFSTIGIAASDFFCINLSTIASILGMSESMAGVTFLAFGNGSPDVFSTFAAMKTHSGSLAVGELIGAAGFITAVVAGSMALVRPFKVARKSFVRDVGFFLVATCFSMVFLADGHLHLWECAVMVVFYVFYVIFVVFWHWFLRRRSRRRQIEDMARSHFHIPGPEDANHEEYRDEDEEDGAPGGSRGPTRTISTTDFDNLEREGSPLIRPMEEAADADDETRDRYLAEISSNMRVSKPRPGERRNTINPIRPSLVGALEFRSVLSSLQKSRNIQTIPINLRRYSDDPTFTTAQRQENASTVSNPEVNSLDVDVHDLSENAPLRSSLDYGTNGPNRARAVSANDAVGLQLDGETLRNSGLPNVDTSNASPGRRRGLLAPADAARNDRRKRSPSPSSSNLTVSSPGDGFGYLSTSPGKMSPLQRRQSGDLLAPQGDDFSGPEGIQQRLNDVQRTTNGASQNRSGTADKPRVPRIQIPRSPVSQRSRASSRSSHLSPFPAYYDDPNFVPTVQTPNLRLPPSSIGSESTFHQNLFQDPESKPLSWWPYKVLPTPQILVSTLFPTLYSWKEKNTWDKLLGIIAAPSVFMLAITLPIVEADKDDEEEDLPDIVDPDPGLLSPEQSTRRRGSSLAILPPDSPTLAPDQSTNGSEPSSLRKDSTSPAINICEPECGDATKPLLPSSASLRNEPPRPSQQNPNTTNPPSSPKEWNRWLVATQIFTAPFFIVVLFWANTNPDLSPRNLLLPSLYSLIGSLVAFGILVLTTTPTHAPKHRYILCFLGFIVSIAWISTIANEVVGVLKAFGVILGISDAILGLTIFAVGNSLGDLVADITVARLGYPVMALSACFGGPMLNILLGIGLSGLYMTIQGGEKRHEKHPDRPMKYKPYQIEVGGTLLISGVTLLVTLAGLLIVVPLRGWRMDRTVGWGLIALWSLSTVGNVIVEVLGWGKEF